jgi:hypothetical protein
LFEPDLVSKDAVPQPPDNSHNENAPHDQIQPQPEQPSPDLSGVDPQGPGSEPDSLGATAKSPDNAWDGWQTPQSSDAAAHPGWVPPDPNTAQPWVGQPDWAPESARWAPAARPGAVPLRPLSVGEILDGAITYIRRNPLATLGTAAVLTALSGVIQAAILAVTASTLTAQLTDLTAGSAGGPDLGLAAMSLGQSFGLLLGSIVSWVIGILATGMLTVMMGAAVLGRKLDISGALRIFGPRLPALLALTVMVTAAVLALWITGVAVGVTVGVLFGIPGIVLAVVIVLSATVAAIWLYIRLLLAPVVLILEAVGPVKAWRRSAELAKGSWWRIFGIQLLATVIAMVIAAIVSVPFQLIAETGISADGEPTTAFWVLITIGSVIAGVITLPFTAGVVSLLYVDRRIRREGLDLVLQTQLDPQTATANPATESSDQDSWVRIYRAGRPDQ